MSRLFNQLHKETDAACRNDPSTASWRAIIAQMLTIWPLKKENFRSFLFYFLIFIEESPIKIKAILLL